MSRPSRHQMGSHAHVGKPDEENIRTDGKTTMFAVTATVAIRSSPAWRTRRPMPKTTITQ